MNALLENTTYDLTHLADTVRAAQAGDREAFGRLVERYESMVYNVALRRLRNAAEAEELCQEVFVQALLKLDQLRAPRAVGGWLRAITVNMAINRATRRAPAVSMDPELIDAAGVNDRTPLDEALAHERASRLRAGLGRLGRLDRETLVAFYFDGHSLVEMSDAFDSPVGTIKRRLHVARKRLAAQLDEPLAV